MPVLRFLDAVYSVEREINLKIHPALRLFDSTHPTFDLGSQNEGCDICEDSNVSCPGIATRNRATAALTNCRKQRNILIIDLGKKNQNDFKKGGEIVISFPIVLSIGVMDATEMHNVPLSTISVFDSRAKLLFEKPIKALGDNTWQGRIQYRGDISTIKLDIHGSFGFTHLKFCALLLQTGEPVVMVTEPPTVTPYSWSYVRD